MSEVEADPDVEVDVDTYTVETIMRRIAEDVALVVDRPFVIESLKASREEKRPSGKGKGHISFKLEVQQESGVAHGCLLVPLPDAISLACYVMMVTDDAVKQNRTSIDLDRAMKDAMVEVDNFVGGATGGALRGIAPGASARGAGCQGVKADVRPAFPYEEGQPLLVGRAKAKLHTYDTFDMILVIPVIENVEVED